MILLSNEALSLLYDDVSTKEPVLKLCDGKFKLNNCEPSPIKLPLNTP